MLGLAYWLLLLFYGLFVLGVLAASGYFVYYVYGMIRDYLRFRRNRQR
ncbi:hypothetical protein [Hymenobacter properus]|uniref:Uncharacterized protein n=1 Tax=Hymenobacter properus TaxID=2791026 RepID=A0A931FKR2_9BACT|nr:hypothetical protein [Hymenobacter properus]MBF9141271.1 hypothetical protein [Hymenobacter properus]MBR7720081.1 hypothetical protein [Microvirga sp. SRT04]